MGIRFCDQLMHAGDFSEENITMWVKDTVNYGGNL
jgi:hypothetical protein